MKNRKDKKIITIVTPVFNDWSSCRRIIEEIGKFEEIGTYEVDLIAVDDCSSELPDIDLLTACKGNLRNVRIVNLASNLGPMRAIAAGLVIAAERGHVDAVLVMDADGEDRPEDVLKLISAWENNPNRVVVARRAERSESYTFKLFYVVYKIIFRILVGQTIDFGSFSILPRKALDALVHTPAIWNNLPAAIIRSRIQYSQIETKRGRRFFGKSRMNFVHLSVHGVSAISVFTDVVLIRLIVAMSFIATMMLFGLLIVVAIRFGTNWAIPGWASYVGGSLMIIFIQTLLFSAVALIQLLNFRNLKTFLPVLDAHAFMLKEGSGSYDGSIIREKGIRA